MLLNQWKSNSVNHTDFEIKIYQDTYVIILKKTNFTVCKLGIDEGGFFRLPNMTEYLIMPISDGIN